MGNVIDKRTFLKKLGCGALATATGTALLGLETQIQGDEAQADPAPSPAMPPDGEKNWIWMNLHRRRGRDGGDDERGGGDDALRRTFDQIKAAGIDAVVPQVFNGRTAQFSHPNPLIESRPGILQKAVELAHAAGLELHAWMWTMPCSSEKVVENHSDWYAVNGKGQPAHEKPAYVDYYKFLCPRKPAVQEYVEGTVTALSQIEGLDGVHLDYVRLPDVILAKGLWQRYNIVQDREYPQYDYCYCEDCRREFKHQTGIDPLTDLDDPSADDAWRQFRYEGVSNLVNGRLVPKAREHGKQITAAVFPNWESVRQQWHRWDLDGFLPMLYHSFYEEDVAWIGAETKAALERLKHTKPVYAGLFVQALSAEELEQAVITAREAGASGVSLFSYRSLREEHWQVLQRMLAGKLS